MLDYDAFRAEQAAARGEGRYLGVGMSTYVEPSTPGLRLLRHRGGHDPHRAVGRRSTSTSPAARPGTASRPPSSSSPPTPSASTSTTSPPSRATPRSPASAPAPAGSRSGSMTAGAVRADGGDPARAHLRHRRPQAGGGARGHRAGRRPGQRPGHAADRRVVRRDGRPRLLRAVRPAARHARRAGGQRPLHGRRPARSA